MPKEKSKDRELTPKQESFCQHYTTHWNATRAAKAAGYSEESAMVQGYQLLQIPLVQARIKELGEHALKEIGVTRERILTEYARIAFLDLRGAYDDQGNLLPPAQLPEDVARAISGIEVDEIWEGRGQDREQIGETRKVRFSNKVRALDSLTKCLGMAPERVEHSGPGGKPIETRNLSDEELDAKIKALMARERPPGKEEE